MYLSVENPGGGDCAFHAYAIGLIDIIKRENEKNGTSATLVKWKELASGFDVDLQSLESSILSFDYEKQDKELLVILQASLRHVIVVIQRKQLEDKITKLEKALEQNDIKSIVTELSAVRAFEKFSAICYEGSHCDARYNDLAGSAEVRKLAQELSMRTKRVFKWLRNKEQQDESSIEAYTQRGIAITFLTDVFGKDYHQTANLEIQTTSSIYSGLDIIKETGRWGTQEDLALLSGAFDLNFHYLINGREPYPFKDEPRKPTIIINNVRNLHWNTRLQLLTGPVDSSLKEFQVYAKDSLLTKQEISRIFMSYTNSFMIVFGGRHHLQTAKKIIDACAKNDSSIDDIIKNINAYCAQTQFSPDSSFKKRVDYTMKRHEYCKNPQTNQISATAVPTVSTL